jgi:signal transduction histidine kinase
LTGSSLRLRLLLAWAVFIALTLQIAGIGLYVLFERSISRRTQAELEADLRQLSRGMDVHGDGTIEIVRPPTDPQFFLNHSGRYWQIEEAGRVVLRSSSLVDETLPLPEWVRKDLPAGPLWLQGPLKQKLYTVVTTRRIEGAGGSRELVLTAAVNAIEIEEDTRKFSTDLFKSLTALAGILLLGAWAHVTIGLRPLERLRSSVSRVRSGADRDIAGDFPDEVMPLVSETNALLAAQEDELARARERAEDLAHGLKTPLAVMGAKSRELRQAGQAAVSAEIDKQIEIMRRHVERELARARARGSRPTAHERTNVSGLLDNLVSAMQGLPKGGALEWVADFPRELLVAVDKDDFYNMIGNLLENAQIYATSKIRLEACRTEHGAEFRIEDDGPGVPDHELTRILERGQRADTASAGTGLGLAIVSDLVELYGGTVTLSRSGLGGLSAEIVLPD